jgi:crotonobetainyl-CoA:carnitine CoA-transferase CaiB-like acyl-CoA transferase
MKPLAGLRVVDAATILAGPFAASILAEFGADVVKVEQPGVGDPMRHLGTQGPGGNTYWWWSETRNKTSVELDLRSPDGAQKFRELVGHSDVVVENYRTGTMDKWGVGYPSLTADNPRLVWLAISGYGRSGPLSDAAGVARIAEAFTGMSDLTGAPDGPPGLSGSAALADYVCGLYGALGVMLALEARRTTQRGQVVDMALYDGIARFLDEAVAVTAATGVIRQRMGAETHRSVPHNNFESADGRWVTIACTNDKMFDRLVAVSQHVELGDPRFATNELRLVHRPAVNAAVASWVAAANAVDIVAACESAGVPSAIVATVSEYIDHPQVAARQSLVRMVDERFGELLVPGTVPRLLDTPGSIDRLGAELGERTIDDILHSWSQPSGGRHVAVDPAAS